MLYIVLTCVVLASSDVDSRLEPDKAAMLVDLINDARASNLAKFKHGTMDYEISHAFQSKHPVRLRASMTWDEGRAFWKYRISDPSKLITGNSAYSKDLDSAPTEYMLLDGDNLYCFNYYTNTLHVYHRPAPAYDLSTYYLFNVFPQTLWSRCCPPFQATGRAWEDMLGKNYEAARPGSKVSIFGVADDLVRQERVRPDGSITELMVSLSYAGNVTSMKHTSATDPNQSEFAEFRWSRLDDDMIGLAGVHITRGGTDHAVANPREVFDMKVIKCSAEKGSRFSLGSLKGLLPKNTTVVDHVRETTYSLNPEFRPAPSDERFHDLIETLHSQGFLTPL